MMEVQRVIVQERRQLVRDGLAALLDDQPGIEVLGAVADAGELVALAATTEPTVAVVELAAPWDLNTLVNRVRELHPVVRFVGMHGGRQSDLGRRAVDAGADALASYGGGTSAVDAAILGRSSSSSPSPTLSRTDRRHLPSRSVLTQREREVLRHLAEGMTAADCAAALQVSPKTVDNHKQRIFSKLGVQNQAHAVALAHRIGLLGPSSPERTPRG
jgi:DNA-binding NarL/FixJ family response regulator